MIYICGFAAGGGYEGVWGICPQILNLAMKKS